MWQSPAPGCLHSWAARTVNSLSSCQIQAATVTCCKSLARNKLPQFKPRARRGKSAAGLALCSRFHAWAGVVDAAVAVQLPDRRLHQPWVDAGLGLSPEGGIRRECFLVLLPQEKKRRREENLKRRLENERKAEIVQVVSCSTVPGWWHCGGLAGVVDSRPWALGSSLLQFLSLAPPLKDAVGSTGRTGGIQPNPAVPGGCLLCRGSSPCPAGWGGGTASPSSLRKPGRGSSWGSLAHGVMEQGRFCVDEDPSTPCFHAGKLWLFHQE